MNKPSDDLDYAAEVVDKTVQPELVVKATEGEQAEQPVTQNDITKKPLSVGFTPMGVIDKYEKTMHVRHSSEITTSGADNVDGNETTSNPSLKASGIISFYFLRIVSTLLDLIYCGIILGILSLLLIFCCIFLGKVNPDQNKFAVQMIYWTCLLTLPAVEAWMHFKLQDKGRLTTPGKSGCSFFLVDKNGNELEKGQILLRSYAKYGLLAGAYYLTALFQMPFIVLPFLMFNRRFLHDYIANTQVVGLRENPATTFYPKGSVWTRVVMCWVALTLCLLPFKWKEIDSRANVYGLRVHDFGQPAAHYMKVEEALYPDSGDSWAQGPERLELLKEAIALRKRLEINQNDDVYFATLKERAWLGLRYNDPHVLSFFQEFIDSNTAGRGWYQVGENPYVEYAKLLIKAGKYQEAYAQVNRYLFIAGNGPTPAVSECELIAEEALRLMKTEQK